AIGAGFVLDAANRGKDFVERLRHLTMNKLRFMAFDEKRLIPIAAEKLLQFLARDARQHGGIGNFVTVEMENGKDDAVADWIKKFIRMPACGHGAGLGFAIADDAGDDEVGIIEGGAVSV